MPGGPRYRDLGLCMACGKEREPGKAKCTPCLIKLVDSRRKTNRKYAEKGLCYTCGKNNDRLPKVQCTVCADKRKSYSLIIKLNAFNAYGGPQCSCCKESHIEFLCIDHVNGGGNKHRRQIATEEDSCHRFPKATTESKRRNRSTGTGLGMYAWLKRNGYPPGFRVLCHNCNMANGLFGYCPHEKERTLHAP